MSTFGGGGGGGFSFGSSSNQNSGFGGFGNTANNNSGGFGATTTNTGFGSSAAQSNPFSGSTYGSNTAGAFGNTSNNSSSLFGNKAAASNPFGTSTSNTGTSLFGGNSNSGGGFGNNSSGFGSNNNNTTSNAFGGNNPSSSFSFGGTKPAFGSTTNSAPLFGQGGSGTTGGFGSPGAFGNTGSGTALGQQPVPPSEGTAVVPFSVTIEKESAGSNTNLAYQSISFMPPYQKYSFEELRTADYTAGRRFGNGSGQAGAFGSSTFGGFGATNSGGFGANTNTSTSNNLFGTNNSSANLGGNTSSSGFGGGGGSGGLFGNNANKPAGLFGQQSSGTTSSGLFGTSNNNNSSTSNNAFGGFGSSTGGGLFGNNQNQTQTQNKPTLFGSNTGTGNSTSFSFGNTGNASSNGGGGLFGNNNNSSNAFGSNQQQQPNQQPSNSGGLFGGLNTNNNNNNQQGKSLFGGFGPTASQGQSSGGLFGTSNNNNNTGGGLFGNNNNSNANAGGGGGVGLFGNTSNTGSSLFGNNNANNTAKSGGLFTGSTFGANSNNNSNSNTGGGGLFGNSNNANQPSGGLFSNTNNNNPSGGFSFGGSVAAKPNNSLFGGGQPSNQSGGLFGQSNAGVSLFSNSQNNQPQQQQQQDAVKYASLLDPNPYGQSSIWTGLPVPTPDNSKPLFTPLTATQKMKESQSKPPPSLKLNHSRYMTPPRRGFGFTYSTYGTPNSAASTPGGGGLNSSMYSSRGFNGGSFGRSLGKSASVSNLRSHFNTDSDSVLTPGAFAATTSRYSGGSIRRLTIDRSIRTDLFSRPSMPALPAPNNMAHGSGKENSGQPTTNGEMNGESAHKLKKRVSFDKDTTGGRPNGELNSETGALVRTESDDEEASPEVTQQLGRRTRSSNGAKPAETEQPRTNELAVVPEDRESDEVVSKARQLTDVKARGDPKPGEYWMKPSRAEMSRMAREKLQRFENFEVGRQGCGRVVFNGVVDLTSLSLDDIYDKIVEIRLRSITVYPDASSKPPVGKGLNVPSTIYIENSWPRARNQPSSATSGPIFERHINRLKKIHGTEFLDYEMSTGIWAFKVPHYTRYGLDYDDEDDFDESELPAPPDSIEPFKSAETSVMEMDSDNYDESGQDDTFAFKQKTVPGGFGRQSAIDFESDGSPPRNVDQDSDDFQPSDHDEEMSDNEVSMAGSFPPPNSNILGLDSPTKPILKASRFQGTPGKPLLDLDGDWVDQLQRTISPRKQNRDALRDLQSKVLLDRLYKPIEPSTANKKEFRTSIDVMNSLFSRHEERRAQGNQGQAKPDFEV